ncbi:MAG: hypothetical protein ABS76_33545 [Pelagibacterium sp. SCN 64-44]|nr:MAG: hypothetical protein ABS76_33545 [Pelagibacterium sp. SCN 64-44]
MVGRQKTRNLSAVLLGAGALALTSMMVIPVSAQTNDPIKLALAIDLTGAFEEAARQTHIGIMLGLEYATGGTMEVAGHPIEVSVKDTALKADLARSGLAEAFGDEGADIAVGGTGSSQALAMAPVAAEYQKVLFVEGGVADEITGSGWNPYVFRVSRSAGQDAVANARAIATEGTSVATLAFDYSAGRSTIDALRTELEDIGANLVLEEYAAADSIDFTAAGLKLFEALSKVDGDRVIWVNWFGPVNPVPQLERMSAGYPGIRLATYGNTFSYMKSFRGLEGMEGATAYYYDIVSNPVNDWLVEQHEAVYNGPPDMFVASAFATAIAIVRGLEKTNGDPSADVLIPALEGMSFDTPKGEMIIRKEDHQAMQDMYHFKTVVDPDVLWGVPKLVRVIPKEELNIPIHTTAQ